VEGLRDEKCVTTQITSPQVAQLKVDVGQVAAGTIGVPITLQITVSNAGTLPASNVLLTASFDAGLEHDTHANPVELPLGTLAPGESKTVPLVLTPRREGRLVTRITATADGGLKGAAEAAITVQAVRLSITKTGPKTRYVDQAVTWEIRVTNPGELPLNNVVIRDPLPPEVAFTGATALGQFINGQVVWNVGTLQAREEKVVQVTARCAQRAQRLVNTAVVTADPGVQEQAEAQLEILGLPAFSLEVRKVGDPVAVGSKMTYQIIVTNTGSLPATGVEMVVRVPPEMQVANSAGPTQARVDGQNVLFPAVEALQPKQAATYTVEVLALRPGDVRLQAELRSTTLREPVIKQESTNIIVPNGKP
jgi:uncharacterized repeat protein (TIGR01451 family)